MWATFATPSLTTSACSRRQQPEFDPGLGSATNGRLLDYLLDDEAYMLAETIAAHAEATGTLPTDRKMTLEERDDAFVLNCCQGSKINEALGNFLFAMASTKSGKKAGLSLSPPALRFSRRHRPEDIVGWLMETPRSH